MSSDFFRYIRKNLNPLMENNINRHEFLKSLGFKGGALLALYCGAQGLSSCSKDESTVVPASVNVTLDITNPSYAALANTGGYVVVSNVVVANIGNGSYVAASLTCPHENRNSIRYQSNSFYCPEHGATFNNSGTCTNGITNKTLKIYNISKSGNTLTIS
jgi:nitrite reductase/ring-hydroxylating ferredoxin subunit